MRIPAFRQIKQGTVFHKLTAVANGLYFENITTVSNAVKRTVNRLQQCKHHFRAAARAPCCKIGTAKKEKKIVCELQYQVH
jgi:Iap family predicted aminopeptidase